MLTYFVIVPILIAVFLYLFSSDKVMRVLAILTQAALLFASLNLFFLSREETIITNIGGYLGLMGIVLRADMLSSVFILLTSFIFLISAIYNFHEKNSRLFWFLLFIWEGCLIGLFLARDFFNAFVLMEVTTVLVTILIMYKRHNRSLNDGFTYLMINIVGIQFYLFGLGYLYMLTGLLDMEGIAFVLRGIDNSQLVLPYALIMTSVAFKCALLPLYSWLPKAHGTPGAPSCVSAILSGLHIKSGLYLFLRFHYVFGDMAVTEFFLIIGVITCIVGILMALAQTDIKLVLAYSTIAQVGLIIIGINLYDTYSQTGSLFHIVNHAIFKAALFLSAGILVHAYGTRDINKIGGVFKRMPLMSVAMIMAILGIIGAPFFNGSISKYFMMRNMPPILNWIVTFVNLGTVMVFIKYSQIFFGSCCNKELPAESKDMCKQSVILILGVLCLGLGVFGVPITRFLFDTDVNIDTAGYLQKSGIFAISLTAGFFIYKHFIRDKQWLVRIGKVELNFRTMCAALGAFFAMVLFAGGLLY